MRLTETKADQYGTNPEHLRRHAFYEPDHIDRHYGRNVISDGTQ